MRKRVKASDGVDTGKRLVWTHRAACDRAECHFAVGRLQLAKCARALLKLDQGVRLDRGGPIRLVWQSTNVTGDRERMSHRFRAQPGRTLILRPAGCRPEIALLTRDLGHPGRVVERMHCARESFLLRLRFRWAARLRHEFLRLAQRIASVCDRNSPFPGQRLVD